MCTPYVPWLEYVGPIFFVRNELWVCFLHNFTGWGVFFSILYEQYWCTVLVLVVSGRVWLQIWKTIAVQVAAQTVCCFLTSMAVSNSHSRHAWYLVESQVDRSTIRSCFGLIGARGFRRFGLSNSTRTRLDERAAHGWGAHRKCRVGASGQATLRPLVGRNMDIQ